MAEVKCAFCDKGGSASQMYRCNYCEFWLHKHHAISGFLSGPKCPKCTREVK